MVSNALQLAGAIGLCISLYAVYVEHKNEEDPSYEAACDISEKMSCSKVLMSEWGHIASHLGIVPQGHPLDLANATLGEQVVGEYSVFYFLIVTFHQLLPFERQRAKARAVFLLTIPVVAVSLYLMYILFVVLGDICLVCVSIYVVNAAVFVLSFLMLLGPSEAEVKSASGAKCA